MSTVSEHVEDNGAVATPTTTATTSTTPSYFRLKSTGHDVLPHDRRSSFHRKKATTTRRFSVLESTEQHHRTDEQLFFGSYAHLRKKLDYTYHSYYRKERQWFQDSIIEDLLDAENNNCDGGWCHADSEYNNNNAAKTSMDNRCCPTPSKSMWLVVTVGAQGAGKNFTIRKLVQSGRLPLWSYVPVDPDAIRRRLPEFSTYLESVPELVDDFTNKECGYITEILTMAGIQAGKNVVLDGALQDGPWFAQFFQNLREEYPTLKIGMIHVVAPKDSILQRASELALHTGRIVPQETIDAVLEKIPESIEVCKPVVDFFCAIHNVDTFTLEGTDWETFTATFVQQSLSTSGMEELVQRTSLRKSRYARRFSVLVSTETNHKSDDMNFYGRYSHIRKTLDYSYHKNYTFERQKFQDAIVDDFLNAAIITDKDGEICTTPTEPWLVFTAGAMGAGKSYTMSKLVEMGHFPILAFVLVDPDEIRRRLPEFHLYVDHSPELAGELTRKEAGFISEILTLAGLQAGKNVLVDGSLRDAEWYQIYFQRLRSEFPVLRLSIIHITAPREAIFQRAAERAIVTGRIVPKDVLEAAIEQVPRSVKVLGPLVDYFCELNNAPGLPQPMLLTPGETWQSFQSQWLQTCAWVPDRKKLLKNKKSAEEKLALVNGVR